MLGDLFGKIAAAPLRIVNIPIRVAEEITGSEGEVSDLVSEMADETEDATRDVFDD